ncbi:MAG: hypothetical protein H6742_20685 [Alphaproteobacteria bacterium]|nr:hypothetical protein [Alphaproteobacteria bacterium]
MRHLALLFAPVLLTACFDKADEDEDDGHSDTDDSSADPDTDSGWGSSWDSGGWMDDSYDPGTETGETLLECRWDSGGIDVMLTGGSASGYYFGLAEAFPEGWTGEDCYLGYTTGDGTTWEICHPLSRDGGYLISVGSFSDLVPGSTTIHRAELDNTYYLEEAASGLCWTWGDRPEYYAGLGCTDISSALRCDGD